MLDTNVIISAALFPVSSVGKVLTHISKNHKLVLCQYTLDELSHVFERKFPERKEYLNEFIRKLKFELVDVKIIDYKKYPKIRDAHDMPILANAIETKVHLLITGDKDFDKIAVESPRIINPTEYTQKYMNC